MPLQTRLVNETGLLRAWEESIHEAAQHCIRRIDPFLISTSLSTLGITKIMSAH